MRTYAGIALSRVQDPALRDILHTMDLALRQLSISVGGNTRQGSMGVPTVIENEGLVASSEALLIAGATAVPGQAKLIRVESDGSLSVSVDAVDTELPPAATLVDGAANPTAPVVAAYMHVRNQAATTYSRASSELANANVVGDATDRGVHMSDVVKYRTETPTNINDTYDDAPTGATSGEIDVRRFREGIFLFSLASTSTPTDITFDVQFSDVSGGTFFSLSNTFWADLRFDDTICSTQINRAYTFPILGNYMRIVVTCIGTSSTKKFTVSNARVVLKN